MASWSCADDEQSQGKRGGGGEVSVNSFADNIAAQIDPIRWAALYLSGSSGGRRRWPFLPPARTASSTSLFRWDSNWERERGAAFSLAEKCPSRKAWAAVPACPRASRGNDSSTSPGRSSRSGWEGQGASVRTPQPLLSASCSFSFPLETNKIAFSLDREDESHTTALYIHIYIIYIFPPTEVGKKCRKGGRGLRFPLFHSLPPPTRSPLLRSQDQTRLS